MAAVERVIRPRQGRECLDEPGRRWFSALTTKKLQRSAHRDIKALAADIRAWIETWNEDATPFTWHKSADEILQRLAATAPPSTKVAAST